MQTHHSGLENLKVYSKVANIQNSKLFDLESGHR